jgi:hypothetical protein
MNIRASLALFALALACTSIEGRDADPPVVPPPVDGTGTPTDPTPSTADVRVAISSVLVEDDCPETTPPAPTQAPMRRAPPGSTPPGVVASKARWSCQQSAMQVSFDNVGKRDANVRIEAVRMIDLASDRSVATLVAREPRAWSDGASGYGDWDQRVVAGKQVAASYELTAPEWGRVAGMIGNGDLATHAFALEVEVAIDGATTTVRSPEFTRPPVHVTPPT